MLWNGPDESRPRAAGWPGLWAWIGMHWRAELSVPRMLLVSGCLVLGPFLLGALLSQLLDWVRSRLPGVGVGAVVDALQELLYVCAMVLLVAELVWWCYGMHRKFQNLLGESRFGLAAMVFLAFLGAGWLTLECSLDVARTLSYPWRAAAARAADSCDRSDREWVHRPWSVLAMPELGRIVATGSIGEGSAAELQRVLRQYPQLRLLELDSPGGLVREMWKLEEMVARHQLDTLVLGRCASACTSLFLAGQRRYIGAQARFGFHRAGYCGMPPNRPWTTTDYMTSIDYRAKGLDEAFIQEALDAPFEGLWMPAPWQLKRAGFATHWWDGSWQPVEVVAQQAGVLAQSR